MAWIGRHPSVMVPGLVLAAVAGQACADRYAGAGALEAEKAALEREVQGWRDSAARLDRGDPVFPASDVLVGIDEAFVQKLIAARLPLTIASAPYSVTLTLAEVGFSGAPTVRLRGTVARDGVVALEAAVALLGALSQIDVDRTTSTLRAVIAVDHLEIERASGIESILSGSSMGDVARLLRESIAGQLPVLEIPVRIQEDLHLPAITGGPLRMDGARLPIKVIVSRVLATDQRLWVSLQVDVGRLGSGAP